MKAPYRISVAAYSRVMAEAVAEMTARTAGSDRFAATIKAICAYVADPDALPADPGAVDEAVWHTSMEQIDKAALRSERARRRAAEKRGKTAEAEIPQAEESPVPAPASEIPAEEDGNTASQLPEPDNPEKPAVFLNRRARRAAEQTRRWLIRKRKLDPEEADWIMSTL